MIELRKSALPEEFTNRVPDPPDPDPDPEPKPKPPGGDGLT